MRPHEGRCFLIESTGCPGSGDCILQGAMLTSWPLWMCVPARKVLFLFPYFLHVNSQEQRSINLMMFVFEFDHWPFKCVISYFMFSFTKQQYAGLLKWLKSNPPIAEQLLSETTLLGADSLNPFQQTQVNIKFQPPQHFSRLIGKVCAELC